METAKEMLADAMGKTKDEISHLAPKSKRQNATAGGSKVEVVRWLKWKFLLVICFLLVFCFRFFFFVFPLLFFDFFRAAFLIKCGQSG